MTVIRKLGWLEGRQAPVFAQSDFSLLGHLAIDLAASFVAEGWCSVRDGGGTVYTYERLIAAPAAEWKRGGTVQEWPPRSCPPYGWSQMPFTRDRLAGLGATPSELAAALENDLANIGLSSERRFLVLTSPSSLLRAGYRYARQFSTSRGVESYEFATGLSMVGIGASAFLNEEMCETCFRLAAPGHMRCLEHSQSKMTDNDTPTSRAMHSHAARAARGILKSGLVQTHLDSIPLLRFNAEWAVASMLWELPPFFTHLWDDEIVRTLGGAPFVRALLPANFFALARRHRLKCLRATIDPHEWVMPRWPSKIQAAERWIGALSKFAPGRRVGPTIKSQDTVRRALALLEMGWRPAKVAERLNISRSNLSHLLARSKKQPTGEPHG